MYYRKIETQILSNILLSFVFNLSLLLVLLLLEGSGCQSLVTIYIRVLIWFILVNALKSTQPLH